MMSSVSSGWVKFFKDAGIPPDLSAKYAVMFCDHRIHKEMLADLDRDILSDIGITAVGDKMAILKQAKFFADQAKRDKTSKILADGIKSLENRSSKSSSPAARMITHSINSRDYSLSGQNSPKQNSPKHSTAEDLAKKSVFERLGQDTPSPKKSGVFSRLGGETQGVGELPYAGILKKTPVLNVGSEKKMILVKTKAKSTSVLDRLGSANTEDHLPDSSTQEKKKVSISPLRVKKSVLLTTVKPVTGNKKTVSLKKMVRKQPDKTSNVLDRLGEVVTSTTKQLVNTQVHKVVTMKKPNNSTEVHKVVMVTKPKKLIIRVPKKQTKETTLKRKSTGDLDVISPKRPISSNTVSSTSSAGIFKGDARSSSVFARLGKK